MPAKGRVTTGESRERYRQAALRRGSWLVKRGIVTQQRFDEAKLQGQKWCTDCKQFRDLDLFAKGQLRCRGCSKLRHDAYHEQNREALNAKRIERLRADPEHSAAINRKSKLKDYGVTPEWYDEQLARQDGKCAICRSEVPGGQGRFHIDHNHDCHPEKNTACDKCRRGLLCVRCNVTISRLESDPGWFHRAMDYLKGYGSI